MNSGSTIAKTLEQFESEFAALTDELIAYLAKAASRTTFSRAELLEVTSRLLGQSLIAFQSLVNRDKLSRFVATSRIAIVVDEAFTRAQQRLTLRLREFAFGLDDNAPSDGIVAASAPASNRYVTLADNQKGEIKGELGQLRDIVRGDNEVDEEAREIALSEIAVFEATIMAPRAANDLIDRFVKRVLAWISIAFGGALLAEVAQRLVQALLPLLN